MKAQISFFIILAFVIVLALGIGITMLTTPTEKRAERETVAKQKTPLQVQPVKDAINNCLKITAKDALVKLGKQGGYLYQSEGGSVPTPPFLELGKTYVEYDGEKTRYLVHEPEGQIGELFFTTPPKYPWDVFPYLDIGSDEKLLVGFYGTNQLPALYRPAKNSLQEQIETYIANNVKSCVPFDSYPALKISAGQPNVTLYLANEAGKLQAEEGVYFGMKWPVDVKEKNGGATTTITDFGTTLNIPLAKIYYNVTSIINQDVQNITYEPATKGNYVVAVTKTGIDSVVSIKFPIVRVDDAPYEFRFARRARLPALHLVKELKNTLQLQNTVLQDTCWMGKGSTITIQNNKLQFSQSCPVSGAVTNLCPNQLLDVTVSDPDSAPNNQNIQLKFDSMAARDGSQTVKFDKLTEPNERIEVKLTAQKMDAVQNKKEDSQTFWVKVYNCV